MLYTFILIIFTQDESANQINGNSQHKLAERYQNGWGIEMDLGKAFYWYQKSAESDNKIAQLTVCLVQTLAESDNEIAQLCLAKCYQHGWGIKTDLEKALYWYQVSAENCNKEAAYLLQKLAESNNEIAQLYLAKCYQNGWGIEMDLRKAFYWYQKSAENDNKEAVHIFQNLAEDDNKIAQSAKQNNSSSQYNLAKCYQYGWGSEIDLVKAFYWYQKSAFQNNNDAQYNLAKCYQNGWGIKIDLENAFYWYQNSVKNDNKFAQYYLAECYQNGWGIKINNIKAFEFYEKSAKQEYIIHNNNAKITDFGISKIENNSTIYMGLCGRIAYIDPQILINQKFQYIKPSDIYSYGVLMWEISSGYPPFKEVINDSYY
ncbi:19654_t:CDS:2 [Funneliformis geosporum]|nr:19654_t:CDS:2 [Funneliformis geosporum]